MKKLFYIVPFLIVSVLIVIFFMHPEGVGDLILLLTGTLMMYGFIGYFGFYIESIYRAIMERMIGDHGSEEYRFLATMFAAGIFPILAWCYLANRNASYRRDVYKCANDYESAEQIQDCINGLEDSPSYYQD